MLLCTLQPQDYATYKNPRYADIKKMLGIPQDQNIYWCFPANSAKQFILYLWAVAAMQPAKILLFETEEYTAVDGVRWDYYVENDLPFDKECLKTENTVYLEYIVSKLPEKIFEIDVPIGNMLINIENAAYPKDIMTVLELGTQLFKDALDYGMPEVAEDLINTDIRSCNMDVPEELLEFRKHLLVFTNFIAPIFYAAGLYYFGYGKRAVHISVYTNADMIYNLNNQMHIHSYKDLETLQEDYLCGFATVYKEKFSRKADDIKVDTKIYPNDPCPCGSGKKYKKCCMNKKIGRDDLIQILRQDTVVYEKEVRKDAK